MTANLNLMTPYARRRAVVFDAIRSWLKIHAVAAVAMLTLWGFASWDCQRASQTRTHLESQYEPIKQLKARTKSTESQIANLRQQERIALLLANDKPILTLIGSISDAAAQSHGTVYILHFDARQSDTSSQAAADKSVIQIRGIGQDDAVIANFVDHLRNQKLFSSVELKSTLATRQNEMVVREFQVECIN